MGHRELAVPGVCLLLRKKDFNDDTNSFLVLSCVHLHFIYSCNNILLETSLGTFYVIYQQYLLKSQSKMFELIK